MSPAPAQASGVARCLRSCPSCDAIENAGQWPAFLFCIAILRYTYGSRMAAGTPALRASSCISSSFCLASSTDFCLSAIFCL